MSDPSSPAKRPRRAFTAKFKAEIVLALLTGTKTQAELCREHELSPNLLMQWKDAFLQNAAAAFETREQNSTEAARISELERALGRATLEVDILKKASSLLRPSKNNGGRS
jgi:transposase-like protein